MVKVKLSKYLIAVVAAIKRRGEKIAVKNALTASESPTGFLVIAGIGLSLVVALNVIGTSPDMSFSQADASPELTSAAKEEDANGLASEFSDQPKNTTIAKGQAKSIREEISEETYELNRGETLIRLLRRAGVTNADAHAIVNQLGKVTNLRKLQRGQEIRLIKTVAADGATSKVKSLSMRDEFATEAFVEAVQEGYTASRKPLQTLELTHLVEGTITDNLYLSASRAGLPDSVIIDLIRMMSFNVDFEREIRVGDQFQVYFERRYAPAFGDTENGRILHVNLDLKKRPLNATWYEDAAGDSGYFDENGASTRRALMKTPLDVAVVTSRYGKRKHPVLGYTRMHKGVDFRAPTGTPIMAAGDGVIEMSARNGSYGNYVRIRHNDTYKTAYGHLSRFGRGIKRGVRVKQGQIIGYSGATGRVTAAHLHYEVLVGGRQSNPMTLKLPTGRILNDTDLFRFNERRTNIVADMAKIKTREQLHAASQSQTAAAR